jgi:hypothetical protein
MANERNFFRSAWAVIAGILVIFSVTTAIDLVLHATGVFPPMGQAMSGALFVLATAYRVIISIAGGSVTARLAPSRPMAHATALGIVGIAFTVAAAIATWNRGPEFGPHWYPIALIVTALPCVWAGAKLAAVRGSASIANVAETGNAQ